MAPPTIPQVVPFTLGRATDINAISLALSNLISYYFAIATGVPGKSTNEMDVTAVSSCVVTHNFGYYPLVQVMDATGVLVSPCWPPAPSFYGVEHSNNMMFTVTWTQPFSGKIIYR